MSWGASYQNVGVSKEFFDPNAVTGQDVNEPHVRAAFDAAVAAAYTLLASRAFGHEGNTWNVSFSGHANPGHEPQDGWMNDSLTISIYQAPRTTPVAAEPVAEAAPEPSGIVPAEQPVSEPAVPVASAEGATSSETNAYTRVTLSEAPAGTAVSPEPQSTRTDGEASPAEGGASPDAADTPSATPDSGAAA